MNIRENIRIAIFSIKTNLMRSLLTMLGIIIGVASVIAIVTLGTGGRDYIVGMIKDMGSSSISITVNTNIASTSDYITREDIKAIKKLDSVAYASPFVLNFGLVSAERTDGIAITIAGNEDFSKVMNMPIVNGRFYNQEEYSAARNVCLIDSVSATNIFGYSEVVGKSIDYTLNEKTVSLKIIGVVDTSQFSSAITDASSVFSSSSSMLSATYIVVMPCTLYDSMMGNSGRYDMVYISATEDSLIETAGSTALSVIKSRHGTTSDEAYTLINMATYIDLLDTVISVFTTFIAAVSGISLLVGGIGVMNIMLVSVTERTREIGIRKALGAKTRTIMLQFLTESIILCMIGGLIGFLIGSGGAMAVSAYMNVPVELKFGTILISVGFSSAIGIFFGIYPARRAAQMHPIDALRHE